jgi:hypothetical protein
VPSSRAPLDLPNFNLNYEKTSFGEKLDFSRFTNRSLGTLAANGVGIGMGGWGEEKINKRHKRGSHFVNK